jgi:MoaA/NifB/PqqE/SkfB family radical SAM enzyme
MYSVAEIRHVHLEISTLCNASCPWCPRNFWGYPYNSGYPETNLTLLQAQKIFESDFLNQLEKIDINGNFGDLVMNPQSVDIVKYFVDQNPNLKLAISTNGGARSTAFWQSLAVPQVEIHFAIDGLEDTHHLYRQNTSWNTVIKNAKAFIQAGGRAVWKMIKFDHNQHQIDQCRALSQDLGFKQFYVVQGERTNAPVFDKQGNFSHTLGEYSGSTEFEILFHRKKTDQVLLEDILPGRTVAPIDCAVKKLRSVYVAANGDVSPCCFLGFYPQTYGHGQYHQAANGQLKSMIFRNNALEFPLAQCIEWFNSVEKSWSISEFSQGRLVICNDVCGKK